MILQALTEYYETLARQGKVEPPGWGRVKVSYAIDLDDDGIPERVTKIETEQQRGKKTVIAPQEIVLPAPVKRTVGIDANFLCDNSGYMLGIDAKGKPARTMECFNSCRKLHSELLDGIDTPAAKTLLRFFDTWQPEKAAACPALASHLVDLLAGGNLVFRYRNSYIHNDPAIQAAWNRYYGKSSNAEDARTICLITGEACVPERIHPSIKNVVGAQSSGAALVSFNAPSFCSYGKEQNCNAPMSQYAAFAYTTALNRLLADREHVYRIGDATVVCWAKGGQSAYQSFLGAQLLGSETSYSTGDLEEMLKSLLRGLPVRYDGTLLDPNMDFYILGLSPNAARLSVRFFMRNSFGVFMRNVQAHYERLEIVRPKYDKFETLPLWKLMGETVNQNARDKTPSPELAGETLMAILNNTRYPATLLNRATLRIRAEHEITRGRAAILKAYYLKNPNQDVPKEVLQVSLNPESANVPYTLGRLFNVLEAIQSSANPNINSTIKDKYFNSASATPAVIFPMLIDLAQKHLKKLKDSLRIYYVIQLTDLIGKLDEEFPAHMSLPQQGAFQLGYYHQEQARYQKKEEK